MLQLKQILSRESTTTMKSRDIFSLMKRKDLPTKPMGATRTFHASNVFKENWRTSGTHLISNVPELKNFTEPVKVAAFDLDGTLINTKSGSTFARGPSDWKLWKQKAVIGKLKELVENGYVIAIFTNQGGVSLGNSNSKSYLNFKERVNQFIDHVKGEIDPFHPVVFASPKKPAGKKGASPEERHYFMRKPQVGMWMQLKRELNKEIDMVNSFYVGDAAGREQDFLDSDKIFAANIKIPFKVPEEFFVE